MKPRSILLEQIALGPDYTMNRLARGASNRADGKRFRCLFWCAVVASGNTFLDDLDLAIEASGATLYQGNIGRKAHFVDMPSRIQIVQSIEDDAEASEPRNGELVVLDVGMVSDDLDVRIELFSGLFGNLSMSK